MPPGYRSMPSVISDENVLSCSPIKISLFVESIFNMAEIVIALLGSASITTMDTMDVSGRKFIIGSSSREEPR
jgi:hypothetical protein